MPTLRKKELEEAETDSGAHDDILTRLTTAGHEKEATRDMVISFIMAGRDTTSAAMTWLFWLLSRQPDVEEDVVKEIESAGEKMSDFELLELSLLKACVYESMRLYPPVAWDSKHAVVADLLPDGTRVQAGR